MIFVTTGTVSYPFNRLVDKTIDIFKNKQEKVIIQSGAYYIEGPLANIEVFPYLPFEKTLSLYKSADLIISACGEVSVHLILRNAKNTPIFVPRLNKFGEHVDNQQAFIAEYLENHKLAKVARNIDKLGKIIEQTREKTGCKSPHSKKSASLEKLINRLDSITKSSQ